MVWKRLVMRDFVTPKNVARMVLRSKNIGSLLTVEEEEEGDEVSRMR